VNLKADRKQRQVAQVQGETKMPDCSPHLLLVGQKLASAVILMQRLEAHGCLWEFVESPDAARRSLDRTDFDVILADSRLPNGGAYDLIRGLEGTRSSLFFWVPVGHSGCWLPVVLRGHPQFDSNAIRPAAFSRTLAALLHVTGFSEHWIRPAKRKN
jgi:CheY-like chemotaxis protein